MDQEKCFSPDIMAVGIVIEQEVQEEIHCDQAHTDNRRDAVEHIVPFLPVDEITAETLDIQSEDAHRQYVDKEIQIDRKIRSQLIPGSGESAGCDVAQASGKDTATEDRIQCVLEMPYAL